MRRIESGGDIYKHVGARGELNSRSFNPDISRASPGICFHSDMQNTYADRRREIVGRWPTDYAMRVIAHDTHQEVWMIHLHAQRALSYEEIETLMRERGNHVLAVYACDSPIESEHPKSPWGCLVAISDDSREVDEFYRSGSSDDDLELLLSDEEAMRLTKELAMLFGRR